ncbi:tetratricopeptide repeat-containing sulfotransferase family protein [uncultured Microbulbifer sp.]|uniref:tetratricopeptide repeat-containing sulfotransferase family protein n=1 Tax=uncultured Microbulbifer sp. TaxID=348147 RepID=UPI0025FDF60A|nr:tetratricopeptide repeat-containing sulfotransferase family protein [uncultured Microbulbifer sp.]
MSGNNHYSTATEPGADARKAFAAARKYFLRGNLSDAQRWAEAVLDLAPSYISGRRLLADILIQRGMHQAARAQLRQALQLSSEQPDKRLPVKLHFATSYFREGDLASALQTLRSTEFAALAKIKTSTLGQLGYLHTLCESHETALEIYEAVLLREPNSAENLFNCAAANRAMGNLERAEALYDRAIQLNPQDWEAYKNRSELRRQSTDRNHVRQLEAQLMDDNKPDFAAIQLNFALAKELEDLGDYSRSFSVLQSGSEVRRKHIEYDVARDLDTMSAISGNFAADFLSAPEVPHDRGKNIIFILGMPRTGSTLLDRILCAAPGVVSAGEPDTFARLLLQVAAESGNAQDENVILSAGETIDINRVGVAYEKQMHARAQLLGGQRIIDKNPMNFLYLGWIARALPAAKIIHLQRDPMDTCYAIYKTLFKSAYPFSYRQKELARYYCGYRELMAHWCQVVPDRIIELDYEQLVSDLPAAGRRIFRQCALSWDDAIQDTYYGRGQGTATASAAQVRQPVYRSSLEKWKHYRAELQPMVDVLDAAGLFEPA